MAATTNKKPGGTRCDSLIPYGSENVPTRNTIINIWKHTVMACICSKPPQRRLHSILSHFIVYYFIFDIFLQQYLRGITVVHYHCGDRVAYDRIENYHVE